MPRLLAALVLLLPAACSAGPLQEGEASASALKATLHGAGTFKVGDPIVFEFELRNNGRRPVRYDGIRDVSHVIPAGCSATTSSNVEIVVTQFSGLKPTTGYDGIGCGMQPPRGIALLPAGAREACRIVFRAVNAYDGADLGLVPGEYEISAAYTDGDPEDGIHRIEAKSLRFVVTD